ncbi:hypothetical protein HJFPF1_12472 [Paramyrothecium foliicola]|nr:hypothetical protein HJFPF1_12472 [Paramyrothecium foliicola]
MASRYPPPPVYTVSEETKMKLASATKSSTASRVSTRITNALDAARTPKHSWHRLPEHENASQVRPSVALIPAEEWKRYAMASPQSHRGKHGPTETTRIKEIANGCPQDP